MSLSQIQQGMTHFSLKEPQRLGGGMQKGIETQNGLLMKTKKTQVNGKVSIRLNALQRSKIVTETKGSRQF